MIGKLENAFTNAEKDAIERYLAKYTQVAEKAFMKAQEAQRLVPNVKSYGEIQYWANAKRFALWLRAMLKRHNTISE